MIDQSQIIPLNAGDYSHIDIIDYQAFTNNYVSNKSQMKLLDGASGPMGITNHDEYERTDTDASHMFTTRLEGGGPLGGGTK